MHFQCEKCDTKMELKEDKHVCPNCSHELSLTEAEELFNDGKLVGIVEDSELDSVLEGKDNKDDDGKDTDGKDAKDKEVDEEDDKDSEDGDDKDKKKKKKDDDEDMQEEEFDIDVSEDVAALFNGADLSEDFVTKASTIYVTSMKANVEKAKNIIKEGYNKKLETETKALKESFADKIEKYTDYVIKEWMIENEVAMEAGLKVEMNTAFIEGMKDLFAEHYVAVPEERYDVLEGLANDLEETKNKLDEEMKSGMKMKKQLDEAAKKEIIVDLSEGLADTQAEKLAGLAAEVVFEDKDQFTSKVETLKESYFDIKSKTKAKDLDESEESVDGNADDEDKPSDLISLALAASKAYKENNKF